ncbi:hypothetical protein CJ030_MR4G013704 [Morella rubra]|uniref:Uncharacterized protein n=1 Tax=Morella rubra TaxID=262757 RepID=A0A6A1WS56_9ROSI|nr:hypothetical protein CJ030_MR4G013704 [Morella rubra]
MFHLIFNHNILMVARLEPFNIQLFLFQTMRTDAQSTSKEGLPFGVMLTLMMLDAEVAARHHEPTLMQLGYINAMTYRCSMAHGSGSQCPKAMSQHLGGLSRAVQEMEHRIVHVVEMTIASIISSLAAMEKRLEIIESMQLVLKKAHEESQEDIMQRM